MTLLGFNIGLPSAPADLINMSLDEMIASRRRDAQAKSKKTMKSVSNVDRSIATARSKRSAAMNARRGLSTTPKASAMEIENEIKKQVGRSAAKKVKQIESAASLTGKGAARAESRRHKLDAMNSAKAVGIPTSTMKGKGTHTPISASTRPPPKKAIKAAINAMEASGFHIPDGMQMKISFAPTASSLKSNESQLKPLAPPVLDEPSKNDAPNRRRGGKSGRWSGK